MSATLSQEFLDSLLPADRTDAFFDALYGEAEEGAYTIKLTLRSVATESAELAFELHQRPEKCLVCSLTYGLPQVFQRHPIINTQGIVKAVAAELGWNAEDVTWQLGRTEEQSQVLHCIPLHITK